METVRKPQTLPQRTGSSNLPPLRPHFLPSTSNHAPATPAKQILSTGAESNAASKPKFRVDAAHADRVPRAHVTFSTSFDANEYEGWTVQDISFAVAPSRENSAAIELAAKRTASQVAANPSSSAVSSKASSSAVASDFAPAIAATAPSLQSTPAVAPLAKAQSLPAVMAHAKIAEVVGVAKEAVVVRTPIESAAESWSARSRAQIVGFDWNESRREQVELAEAPQVNHERESYVDSASPLRSFDRTQTLNRRDDRLSNSVIASEVQEIAGGELEIAAPMWPEMTDRLMLTALPYIRQIGSAMMRSGKEKSSWLLTAPERGAGTTTMGLSVARWLATQNQKVLLVDADFHRAGLSRSLGMDGSFSWLSTLRGERSLREAMVSFSGTNLALLPLAAIRSRHLWPIHLLDRLAGKLNTLKSEYDQILLDVGPMSQWVSETQAIVNVSQRCLLVVRHVGTNHQQWEQTQLRLNGLGIQQLLVANITPTLRAAS